MSLADATPETVKVAINDLSFYYGSTQALKAISLPLYQNKVTAFIGPSGCGKSTLLRVLNRIYELYPNQRAEGEVLLDGENILSRKQDLNLLRAKVGMVFQKPTPFPMTIFDNIAFGIQLYESLPRSELEGRVEYALNRLAQRKAERLRVSFAEQTGISVIVNAGQLGAPAHRHGETGVEHEIDRQLEAGGPAGARAERGRRPVEIAHPAAHLPRAHAWLRRVPDDITSLVHVAAPA